MAADAAFYFADNERAAKAKGVKRVCIPNRSTKERSENNNYASHLQNGEIGRNFLIFG